MAIPLTTSGGLMTRLGHWGGMVLDINAWQGGTATTYITGGDILFRMAQFETDFLASPENQALLEGIHSTAAALQNAQGVMTSDLRNRSGDVLVKMADEDSPLPSLDIRTAMDRLIFQMLDNGDTVNASSISVGSQTAVGTPNGDPAIVVSAENGKGVTQEYLFAETIRFICTADSQSGGATLGQEQIQVLGDAAVGDTMSYLWPAGSSTNQALSAVDPSLDNGSGGNLLFNSDFETFTIPNQPDGWVTDVGTIGTDIKSSTSAYFGTKCIEFLGDGATLSDLYQKFGVDNTTSLSPEVPYNVTIRLKVSAVPAAGVLEVSLIDGIAGTIIQDSAGNNNSFSINLTGATTSYVEHHGTFRMPALLPDDVYIRLALTTAIENGKNLFMDHLGMAQATQLYAGGPFVTIFSGATKLLLNDQWTVAMGNTMGAFQKYFERVFSMRDLGLQLPSDSVGGETISDTLVA